MGPIESPKRLIEFQNWPEYIWDILKRMDFRKKLHVFFGRMAIPRFWKITTQKETSSRQDSPFFTMLTSTSSWANFNGHLHVKGQDIQLVNCQNPCRLSVLLLQWITQGFTSSTTIRNLRGKYELQKSPIPSSYMK